MMKNNKAITLIALVITIVVLIILAAVAINLSLGNNGIFNRAKTGKELYQNAEEADKTDIAKASNQIDSFIGGNREQIMVDKDEYLQLKSDVEILKNKKIGVDCTTGSTASSSWTKLHDYPDGYTYDNCYISSAYVVLNSCKYPINYYDSSSECYVILKSDGIYMYWRGLFVNCPAKIILERY